MKRRQALTALLSGPAVAAGARGQGYPAKPIRVIVGYTAGGALDIVARAVAQQRQGSLGQPVIIENKPGGGTNIAMRALIDSATDGYTLMLTANAIAANMALYQPPPYDLARDVTPISLVGRVQVVLAVNAQSEFRKLSVQRARLRRRQVAARGGRRRSAAESGRPVFRAAQCRARAVRQADPRRGHPARPIGRRPPPASR